MKKAGISKKKIMVRSLPRTRTMDYYDDDILNLDIRISSIQQEGGHLIFCDESIFKARDFNRNAWSGIG